MELKIGDGVGLLNSCASDRLSPDSVERIAQRCRKQRRAEASHERRHVCWHQVKHRELQSHVGSDACTRPAILLQQFYIVLYSAKI